MFTFLFGFFFFFFAGKFFFFFIVYTRVPLMYTAVNLSVVSLNVRGIREQTKRRSIFSYLKDQRANVYFLQETYSEPADENMWKNEWGGKIFFSHMALIIAKVCAL